MHTKESGRIEPTSNSCMSNNIINRRGIFFPFIRFGLRCGWFGEQISSGHKLTECFPWAVQTEWDGFESQLFDSSTSREEILRGRAETECEMWIELNSHASTCRLNTVAEAEKPWQLRIKLVGHCTYKLSSRRVINLSTFFAAASSSSLCWFVNSLLWIISTFANNFWRLVSLFQVPDSFEKSGQLLSVDERISFTRLLEMLCRSLNFPV